MLRIENIYHKMVMTLTDAFNTFIQQSINVEGLPFIVTKNSADKSHQIVKTIITAINGLCLHEMKGAAVSYFWY